MQIIVPYVKTVNDERKAFLYQINAYNKEDVNGISINENEGLGKIQKLVKLLISEQAHIEVNVDPIEDDTEFIEDFDENNQPSMTLGIFLAIENQINNRHFKHNYDYIVVTGDIEGNCLKPIGDEEKKLEALKLYMAKEENRTKKAQFIYVKNEITLNPGLNEEKNIETFGIPRGFFKNFPNIFVKHFYPDIKIEYIYAELFTPEFDAKQEELLRKTAYKNSINFYETKTFQELKTEIKNYNGYLITGKSNSGKTVLAAALVRYAMEVKLVYAPIWIKINNDELQRIASSKNKKQFLSEYLQKKINLEKLESEKNYILVIDNIELNSNLIDDVLIISRDLFFEKLKISISFTIITSWLKPTFTEILNKGTFRCKEVVLSEIQKDDYYGIYQAIADDFCSNNLLKATAEEQEKLKELSFKSLKDKPGNIRYMLDSLKKLKVADLIKDLEETGTNETEAEIKWREKFFEICYEQLGLFSQIILFCFIGDFGSSNQTCSESDFKFFQKTIEDKQLIDTSLVTIASINSAFMEIKSHYLLEENDDGEFFIKNDVLQYFLFKTDTGISNLNEKLIDENQKIKATILYNWVEKLLDLLTEKNRNHVLFEIAKYADKPEFFEKCLGDEIDLNRKNRDGLTLLHVAVKQNPNLEIIKYLIEKGSDWKLLTDNENTLIHLAVENPNVEILRYLLEHKYFEKLDSINAFGFTPYDRAAELAENVQVFALLEKYGLELSEENIQSALFGAAENNQNVEVLKYLIEKKGCNTNIEDSEGQNLLHYAAKNPSIEVLKYVLENHFYEDINKRDRKGIASIINAEDTMEDPFVHSCVKSWVESDYFQKLKKWLVEHPDVSNDKEIQEALPKLELLTENNYEGIGATPLHYAAAFNCNSQALDLLIENGADWHKTSDDFSLIMIAAALNNESVVSHILEQKWFNQNSGKNKTSGNVLHMAARNPNAEVMRLFCKTEFRKYINKKDYYGYTPLLIALEHNPNIKAIEVLLENKADYKSFVSKTKYNLSTLLCAAKNKNPEVFEYVLKQNIFDNRVINERDRSGHTVLMYSLLPQFNPKLFETLVEVYKMDPNDLDDEKNTLLHMAVMANNEEMVEKLINDSEISNYSFFEKFVFSIASIWSKTHISNDADRIKDKVNELNQYYKWDINKKNRQGQTALDLAIYPVRNLKIADILLKNRAHPGDKNGDLLVFACTAESWDIVHWIIDKKIYSEKVFKNLDSETKDLIKQHCPELTSLL